MKLLLINGAASLVSLTLLLPAGTGQHRGGGGPSGHAAPQHAPQMQHYAAPRMQPNFQAAPRMQPNFQAAPRMQPNYQAAPRVSSSPRTNQVTLQQQQAVQRAAAEALQRAVVASRERIRQQALSQVRSQAAEAARQRASLATRKPSATRALTNNLTGQQVIDREPQQAVLLARQRAAEQARSASRTANPSQIATVSHQPSAALRRPVTDFPPAPRKEAATLRSQPGNGRAAPLNREQGTLLVNRLQSTSDPRDRQLVGDIMARRGLSDADRTRAQELLRRNAGDRPFGNALALSLRDDRMVRERERVNLLVAQRSNGRLISGRYAPYPWYRHGRYPYSFFGPGAFFLATLGISPYYPCAFFPLTAGVYDGPGFVTQIDPCAGWVGDPTTFGDVPPEALAEMTTPPNAPAPVFRMTRYLRVANATKEKMKVHVQYRTVTEQGDLRWFPADPGISDQALIFDLAPGEVVDLFDGDWRVNAQAVRVWADSPSTAWLKFKTEDMWLVPETNERGVHGYLAGEAQTFTLAIR